MILGHLSSTSAGSASKELMMLSISNEELSSCKSEECYSHQHKVERNIKPKSDGMKRKPKNNTTSYSYSNLHSE